MNKIHDKGEKSGIIFDTFVYGLQSVLPQLLSFLLLPIFTSVFKPEEYAAVNLATVFATLFSCLITLQLPAIIGRLYFDCEEEDVGVFFSTIFFAALVTIVASTVLITLLGNQLVSIVFPNSDLSFFPLFFLAIISLGISSISSICSILLQVQKRATRLLRISVVVTCVHFGVSIFFVVGLRWGPAGVLLATIISGSLNLTLLMFTVRDYLLLAFDSSYLAPGLRYCLPLIPHYYGVFLYISSDKIVLEKFVSLADVGIYAVAVKLVTPLSTFVEAFNRSNSPRFNEMSKISQENTAKQYRDVITKWFAVTMILWLGFSLFAGEAVRLLTPASYHPAVNLLPVLAAAYVFRGLYCFAVNPLFYVMKTNWIPAITVSAGLVNVALNFLLIPRYGMVAAAWTTLISFALTFVAALLIGSRFYPMHWNVNRLALIAVATLVLYICANMLSFDLASSRIVAKTLTIAVAIPIVFRTANIIRFRHLWTLKQVLLLKIAFGGNKRNGNRDS